MCGEREDESRGAQHAPPPLGLCGRTTGPWKQPLQHSNKQWGAWQPGRHPEPKSGSEQPRIPPPGPSTCSRPRHTTSQTHITRITDSHQTHHRRTTSHTHTPEETAEGRGVEGQPEDMGAQAQCPTPLGTVTCCPLARPQGPPTPSPQLPSTPRGTDFHT